MYLHILITHVVTHNNNTKIQLWNQLLNFFWTLLCFLPLLWYWSVEGPDNWFYGSIIISLACSFLPGTVYQLLQFSNSPKTYEKYGVKIIRRFVQHGDLINRSFRRISAGYKVIKDIRQLKRYLNSIAMYERFHFMCFLFFLFTAFHSLFEHRLLFTLLITIGNFIYNICPIFLQQYNRLRIRRLIIE